jgi:quinolinate synthase
MITVLDKEKVGEEDVQNAFLLENYLKMSDAEIAERIERARKTLGSRVVILGHHYQRDDVIAHADLTGGFG